MVDGVRNGRTSASHGAQGPRATHHPPEAPQHPAVPDPQAALSAHAAAVNRAGPGPFAERTVRTRAGHGAAPLAERLENALPADRFDYPWQRQRLVERGMRFESQVQDMVAHRADPHSALGQLRQTLQRISVDAGAPIELHGVASHVEPETLQAHVRDRSGRRHILVRDSQGQWVERKDLAQRVARHDVPSAAPGRSRDNALARGLGLVHGSATLAVVTVMPDGATHTRLGDLKHFDHMPRARPLSVGDVVQVALPTGRREAMKEGQPYLAQESIQFGRLASTDGMGNWKVELTRDGKPVMEQGHPKVTTLTDAELTRLNNPTLAREGSRLLDMRFDSSDPQQRQMMKAWHESPEYRQLQAERPPLGAQARDRAAWERRFINAADAWLDARMTYPDAKEDVKGKRFKLAELDRQVQQAQAALPRVSGPKRHSAEQALQGLRNERTHLAEAINREDRFWGLTQQISTPSLGDYFALGLGECRHQAAAMQWLLQDAGVDSRMTMGAANTSKGVFRGGHMWLECQLSDGSQMLVDPTWTGAFEKPGDLRQRYEHDLQRVERNNRTLEMFRDDVVSNPSPRLHFLPVAPDEALG